MIREYELIAEGLDPFTWWAVSREYQTGDEAKAAWERLEKLDEERGGALELGIYRHASIENQLAVAANLVTAVGHHRDGLEVADEILAGDDYDLPDEWAQALILRRIDMLAMQIESKTSTYKIRRGRGATIRPDGTVEEFIGGDQPTNER